MKKLVAIITFISACSLHAAESEYLYTPNTYHGAPIIPETLLQLADKFDGASLNLDPIECEPHNTNMQIINHYGPNYWIKISGRINRVYTGMHTLGADGRVYNDLEYRKTKATQLAFFPVKTYQTASRAANYLIAMQAIKDLQLATVGVPSTFLYSNDGKSVDDNHAIIKESHIPGKKLEAMLADGYEVLTHQFKELFSLTESVGIWNPKNNIIVEEETYRLVNIDQEQPNNSNGLEAFYICPAAYHGNVVCGIKDGLSVIFKDDKEEMRLLYELVHNSDIINHEDFTERYKTEILTFVDQQENA